MKKICSLLIAVLMIFVLNVKADMGPPMIANYEIVVANKDGAACYNDGKKTDKVIEYGKVLKVDYEVSGKYISVSYSVADGTVESCELLTSDIIVKDSTYSVNNSDVTKLDPVKAVILAKGGLNLRKGPATVYSRIMTIPQYSVVTLKYRVGTYWFYIEYNGHKGWISGDNQYFGYNDDNILYSYEDVAIHDKNGKKIGTIPALTEITDYLTLVVYDGPLYYVNYKGTLGYVDYMPNKVRGEVKVLADTKVYNKKSVINTIKKDTTLVYSIIKYENEGNDTYFYIPTEKGIIHLDDENKYQLVGEALDNKKTTGFIGEGLFGEKKDETNDTSGRSYNEEENPIIPNNNENNNENNVVTPNSADDNAFKLSKEMIIICVLSCIILALTAFIIIKLVNNKKKESGVQNEIKKEEPKILSSDEGEVSNDEKE